MTSFPITALDRFDQMRAPQDRNLLAEAFDRHGIGTCAMLASTFRSGSTWIGSLLRANGLPGMDKEVFSRAWEDTPVEPYLDAIIAPFAGRVFATKLMWPHRNDLARKLGHPRAGSARFAQGFPGASWLWVRRRDRIGQAISFWRARESDRWHIYDDSVAPELTYDFAGIDAAMRELALHEDLWGDFFATAGIEPEVVWYEDVMADPTVLDRFLCRHGTRLRSHRVALRQQRDGQSEPLRDRFLDDLYARGD